MDFRNCPACKASVLEDDVEDCPFCGASMSGKPSGKPVVKPKPAAAKAAAGAKPQAAPVAAGGKPGAPAAGTRSRPTPEELDDGSDPFEVDTRAVVKAPPVSPKPAKGRMVRVQCPMCETPGFITAPLQGKEVKCCNPDCLMPIFTAPRPEEKPVADEPKRSTSSIIFAVSAVVLIAAVGGALYHFFLKAEVSTAPAGTGEPTFAKPPRTGGQGEPKLVESPPPPTAPPPVPLDEVRETALADIEKSAQQRQNNRSKPFGRRMAAEAFAGAGLLDKAREQLADMQKVPGYVPFYEVDPLVMIADALAAQGDAAGAARTLDEALSKADFPAHGREPLDAASRLATALMAAGRADDARRVAGLADDAGTRGRAFVLWRYALDSGRLDLDVPATRPCLLDMPSTQWVSVTLGLLAKGQDADALAWAQSAPNSAARDNALAVWAWGMTAKEQSPAGEPAPDAVGAVIGQSPPVAQARMWSAIADARLLQGNAAAAQECLALARTAFDQVPTPAATMGVPSLKAIYESENQPRAGLPDPTAARSAALAAADIAQVQAAVGDLDGAWNATQRALAHLRSSAPSSAATRALLDECERGRSGLESRITSELGIGSDGLFLAFNRYRKQCGALHEEATARFDLQVRLLRRLASVGVLEPLWAEVVAREQQTDPAEREPYFGTLLPGTVFAYASIAKKVELVQSVGQAVPAQSLRIDPRDQLVIRFGPRIDVGDFQAAADLLRAYEREEPGDYYTSQLIALRGVSRLIKAGKHNKALDLIGTVTDPLLREDAVQLIAAAAVRDGQHSELWRRRSQLGLSATEMASFYRGCIRGLGLRPASEEAAAPQ